MGRRGTCLVFEQGGRWHIAELQPTGLFGLGGDQWKKVTFRGYRSRRRATRRAARLQKKSYRWHETWEREMLSKRIAAAEEDARIRSMYESGS